MPGDPLIYLAGEDVGFMTTEEKQQVLEDAGLNDPMIVQFGRYIQSMFTGDFGYSYQQKKTYIRVIRGTNTLDFITSRYKFNNCYYFRWYVWCDFSVEKGNAYRCEYVNLFMF